MKRAGRARAFAPASVTRLRLFLLALLIALAVPSTVLVWITQRQLRFEAFHQYRGLAEALATSIDGELRRAIAIEEARAFSDYSFLRAGSSAAGGFLQRSELAQWPVQSPVPGVLGYFQIDASGRFSTPALPDEGPGLDSLSADADELAGRQALRSQLISVLSANRLVGNHNEPFDGEVAGLRDKQEYATSGASEYPAADSSPAPPGAMAESSAFDQLNAPAVQAQVSAQNRLGRIDELKLAKTYQLEDDRAAAPQPQRQNLPPPESRSSRKEQGAELSRERAAEKADQDDAIDTLRLFESEVDPFEFALLDDGHAVLYRKVWRNGQRTVQGAVLSQQAFLQGAVLARFADSALAPMSNLLVAWRGDVLQAVAGGQPATTFSRVANREGELLHQTRLSAPLGDLQLVWTINQLPAGPGASLVIWVSAVLYLVLLLGLWAIYRTGRRQIALAEQQRDFVSAVSHELKTPLTSIRMYAEMLREGWASADKQREYYAFIHDESERLSRLIANVLQLARLERSHSELDCKPARVGELMDMARSRLHTQIERAGFESSFVIDAAVAEQQVRVDADAMLQILINLVDNALKFSSKAEQRRIELSAQAEAGSVVFSVRDYGPGVPANQTRRIFELFFRLGSELTREQPGTGIGLALVQQLARAMGGDVEVRNRNPGAEFRVRVPNSG